MSRRCALKRRSASGRTACTWCTDSATRRASMHRALGKGASDSQLITRYKTDPLMGGTGMNVNFVTLEPGA